MPSSGLAGYNFFIAAIWGLIFLVTASIIKGITGLSDTLIVCLYFYCIFMMQICCWTNIRQYEYSWKIVVFESLTYTFFASFGSVFAVAFISKTAEAKIIPNIILVIIIGLIIVIRAFYCGKCFYDRDIWRYTFLFCTPLVPHCLSETILMNSDRIMIDKICGASSVAMYSVAYSVGSLIAMLTSAVNFAFAPYQYQKLKDKSYRKLAQNTNYIIGFVALCLCGIMLFGQEIVWIFGGKKYIESVSIIIPISLGVFFNYVFQLFARVQQYFEQKYTIVVASVSCAVLNIVLNFIFIRWYGYQAAAYTTFFCYFAFCFLHYVFYRMACKKHVGHEIYDIKGLIVISTVLIIVSIGIYFINSFQYLKYILLASMFIPMIRERNKIVSFVKTIIEKE